MGRLKPGQRLVEDTLAKQCQVSRVPLREAFRILASDGLVTLSPYRGARVNSLSAAEFSELLQLSNALENFAAGKAAESGGHLAEEMEALVARMREAQERKDFPAVRSLAQDFRKLLISAVNNKLIEDLYKQTQLKITSYQLSPREQLENSERTVREFADIARYSKRET